MMLRKRGWIGVDLGTRAVKLVQVERRGTYLDVDHALIIQRHSPWSAETQSDSAPLNSGDEIRAALSLPPGFYGRLAACTLPMSLCDVRSFNIRPGTDAERREEVSTQLSAVYGNELDAREFDFWPIDTAKETQANVDNVSVLSVSHESSMQVANEFSHAGLAVQTLDGIPLALARAIQLGGNAYSEHPVAVVDWGYSRATLCLVAQGCPLFVRCLRDSGFDALLHELSRHLGISLDEAGRLLVEHGLPNPGPAIGKELQQVIAEVSAAAVSVFVEELSRTLTYLTSHRRPVAPDQVVLMGAGATIKNVTTFLEDKIGMPIRIWRPENIRINCESAAKLPLELLGPAIALSSLAWA